MSAFPYPIFGKYMYAVYVHCFFTVLGKDLTIQCKIDLLNSRLVLGCRNQGLYEKPVVTDEAQNSWVGLTQVLRYCAKSCNN